MIEKLSHCFGNQILTLFCWFKMKSKLTMRLYVKDSSRNNTIQMFELLVDSTKTDIKEKWKQHILLLKFSYSFIICIICVCERKCQLVIAVMCFRNILRIEIIRSLIIQTIGKANLRYLFRGLHNEEETIAEFRFEITLNE